MVLWGSQGRWFPQKRSEEIKWPDGSCIALQDLKGGMLAYADPHPVRIVATRFLVTRSLSFGGEIDEWVALEPGQFLQGCYFRREQERAVYLVTVPPAKSGVISQWPRIIGGNRKSDRK